VKITSRQAEKLFFKKSTRNSPFLEKCCLLLTANCSFQNAEVDLEKLTGIKVSSSSQHRLVEKYNFPETAAHKPLESLSLDGGKVRVRTPLGEESQWRDYKAISLHEDVCLAFFQNNPGLVDWINRQPFSRVITCIGDGHDGVWNLITQIGEKYQRREVLDWYHLMENLHKIDGHSQEVKAIKNYLWRGEVEEAIGKLKTIKKQSAFNFKRYLYKHYSRIPDYSLYKELNICIGSGSVESTIKRIGARIKISGAQYLEKNVPQYLKLRCAYLNGHII
jgi:hypothetical protein